MGWRAEVRACTCGVEFKPKRERQRFCSAKCGSANRMSRKSCWKVQGEEAYRQGESA
jgi:hypothetical protein